MYNAIIIDDEPTARDILERHLSKIETIAVVASCKSAIEGFSALSTEQVDIVFLDINMPEVTGLMFANAIKGKTEVIFTTAHREYALEGFELQALDYLLKPISLERLMQGVQKFLDRRSVISIDEEYDFTFFRCDRKMVKVDFESITHIESCGDYIKIFTDQKTLITRETMTKVVDKLPMKDFLRTHRSFVISIPKIESFTNEHIAIGKLAIPIGRSFREHVLSRLDAL